MLGNCYSIVELETSWKKETCIHVELGNFIFFPFWFGIVLYINRFLVINDRYSFFPSIISDYMILEPRAKKKRPIWSFFLEEP